MTTLKSTSVRVSAEPCFSLRKAYKLVQFPGTFPRFIQWLKDCNYIMQDLEPYKRPWEKGLFVYTFKKINVANKTVCITRITIKGIYFIKQKLKNQLNQSYENHLTESNPSRSIAKKY